MSTGGVERSWSRIETWLCTHAPGTFAALNPPAEPAAIAAVEEAIGVRLPDDVVVSLCRHDGSGTGNAMSGRFDLPRGYGLLSVQDIQRRWRMLTDILSGLDAEMTGYWWHPQWVPIAEHVAADALVVDQRPGQGQGRVGEFSHEDSTSFGRWPSFAALLAETADLLEGRQADDRAVPRVASGRLIWGWAEQRQPDARSLLAIADAAGPDPQDTPVGTEPRNVARGRATPRPADPAEWILDMGRCCLTFARDLTAGELISRFGGDPDRVVELTAEQAAAREDSWRSGYRPVLRAGHANGWAFGFEQRREYGVAAETLRRVSAGTQAVSVACNGNITQLRYAEDGVVLVGFDSRWPERLEGADPERFRPLLEQANLLPPDPEQDVEDDALAALALAILLGPGRFDPALLAAAMPAAPLLPLLPDPPTEPRRLPVQADPELVAAIEYATEEQLRPAVIALARRRAVEIGLDGYPEISAALDAAAHGPAGPIDDDSALGRTIRTLHAESHAAGSAWRDHGDPSARALLTDLERATWHQRGRLAGTIAEILARPAVVAAYSLIGAPAEFAERAEFQAALADVDVPADAVRRLEQAEQQRRRSAPAVALRRRRSRRRPLPALTGQRVAVRPAGFGFRAAT